MKAVILSGGEGRRLRPVTGDMPKPLSRLCGRSMLEHIIRLLAKNGFDEVCLAVKYRYEDIISEIGDGSALGVKAQYRIEKEPLGTAGAVKNCADFYGDEDFLVISGDAACDFDLKSLMDEHKKSGAAAAIALYRCSEPLRFGLAVTDSEGWVKSFVEKPEWERVVSDLVNTGIYVLSPRAMEYVPEGKQYDFGKELFPLMLSKGEKILGRVCEGYWCDVGTPLSYYSCCVDALKGRLKVELAEEFITKAEEHMGDECGVAVPCRDRAATMSALSSAVLDLGADYSDGISLDGRGYHMHIFPSPRRSSVCVDVKSSDAEFARELTMTAKELIEALGL